MGVIQSTKPIGDIFFRQNRDFQKKKNIAKFNGFQTFCKVRVSILDLHLKLWKFLFHNSNCEIRDGGKETKSPDA